MISRKSTVNLRAALQHRTYPLNQAPAPVLFIGRENDGQGNGRYAAILPTDDTFDTYYLKAPGARPSHDRKCLAPHGRASCGDGTEFSVRAAHAVVDAESRT